MSKRLLALALISSAALVSTQASAAQTARMFCPTSQGIATLDFQKVDGQTKEGKTVKAVMLEIGDAQLVLPAEPLEPIFQGDLERMDGVAMAAGPDGQILFQTSGNGGFGKALVRITIAMKNPETNKVEAQILRDCQMVTGRIGF